MKHRYQIPHLYMILRRAQQPPRQKILTIDESDSSATPSIDSINSGFGTPVKAESPYSEPPTTSLLGEKGVRISNELGGLFAKTIFQRFGFRQCLGASQSENCGQNAGTTVDQGHDQSSGRSSQTAKRQRDDPIQTAKMAPLEMARAVMAAVRSGPRQRLL